MNVATCQLCDGGYILNIITYDLSMWQFANHFVMRQVVETIATLVFGASGQTFR